MIIRKFRESDAEEVSRLIEKVFIKSIAETFRKKGVRNFLKHETAENVLKRARTRAVMVAVSDRKIIGVVEIAKDESRIRRLFVDNNYQGKGIGSRLFRKMERVCMERNPKSIKIYASVNAVGFYESMGYRKFGGIRENKEGIIYQLMVKKFR